MCSCGFTLAFNCCLCTCVSVYCERAHAHLCVYGECAVSYLAWVSLGVVVVLVVLLVMVVVCVVSVGVCVGVVGVGVRVGAPSLCGGPLLVKLVRVEVFGRVMRMRVHTWRLCGRLRPVVLVAAAVPRRAAAVRRALPHDERTTPLTVSPRAGHRHGRVHGHGRRNGSRYHHYTLYTRATTRSDKCSARSNLLSDPNILTVLK